MEVCFLFPVCRFCEQYFFLLFSVGCEWPHREGACRQSDCSQIRNCRKSSGPNQLEDAYLSASADRCSPPQHYLPASHQCRTIKLLMVCNSLFFLFSPDLRRFRTYKGNSVRDLLRAMRNKVSLHLFALYSSRTIFTHPLWFWPFLH